MRFREVRLQADGLPKFGDPLLKLPLLCYQGAAEGVMGHADVGLQLVRLAEFGDRLLGPMAFRQDAAEVVVGHRVVGLEAGRLAEFGDRLLRLPRFARARPR